MRVQQADVPPTRVSAAATLDVRCCREARRRATVQEVKTCPSVSTCLRATNVAKPDVATCRRSFFFRFPTVHVLDEVKATSSDYGSANRQSSQPAAVLLGGGRNSDLSQSSSMECKNSDPCEFIVCGSIASPAIFCRREPARRTSLEDPAQCSPNISPRYV